MHFASGSCTIDVNLADGKRSSYFFKGMAMVVAIHALWHPQSMNVLVPMQKEDI